MSLIKSVLLLSFIVAVVAGSNITVAAMTYHDNIVVFPLQDSDYHLVAGAYTIQAFSVTSGQDPDGNIHNGLVTRFNSKNEMSFRVGRHGSSAVANWFSSRIRANQTTFNHDPGELNFAFIGMLELTLRGAGLSADQTYTFRDIALAQGHTGTSNNWWFGGTSCSHRADNRVSCTGTSPTGYQITAIFHRGGNSVNEVAITDINIPGFKTVPLVSTYRGENYSCTWQWSSPAGRGLCPPYVTYYNSSQSGTIRLKVDSNTLKYPDGSIFDTSRADPSHSGAAAIFVMDTEGRIYASNAHKVFLFHHSSLLGGISVAAAGELSARDGVITRMTNCSGHYRPPFGITAQAIEGLSRQGYSRTINYVDCSTLALEIELDYGLAGE